MHEISVNPNYKASKKQLFLYLDFLGFENTVNQANRANVLFELLDRALIHEDRNFKTIVFSDTLIAYQELRADRVLSVELMYLIELTQDIFIRLIGRDFYFRAIITYGEFNHNRLSHLDAYYGAALIRCHKDEKNLRGAGLFLDKKLSSLNHTFAFASFNDDYDYIYLTQNISHLYRSIFDHEMLDVSERQICSEVIFPCDSCYLIPMSAEIDLYPELVFIKEIHQKVKTENSPRVREIFLTMVYLYSLGYPELIAAMEKVNFSEFGVSDIDWNQAKVMYGKNYQHFEGI